MRREMETQLRQELAQRQGTAGISEQQMAEIRAQAARQAKEEVRLIFSPSHTHPYQHTPTHKHTHADNANTQVCTVTNCVQ